MSEHKNIAVEWHDGHTSIKWQQRAEQAERLHAESDRQRTALALKLDQAERALLEQSLAHQENIRRIRVECDAATQEYEHLRTQLHAAQEALKQVFVALSPRPTA